MNDNKKKKVKIEKLDFDDNIDIEFEIDDITDLSNEKNNVSQGNSVEQKLDDAEQNASSKHDDVEKDIPSNSNNDVETLDMGDESSSNQGNHEDNNENKSSNSSDNTVSSGEDKNNDVQDYNNLDGTPEEKQSLRDKAKETANKIKNAPEDIRNKVNDTKEKTKETVDKIKNAPENIKNKVNDTKDKVKNVKDNAKEKWENRPKNFNEFKEQTKNGIKNGGKKLGNKIANNAQDAIDHSNTMKKINKAKDDIEKVKKVGRKVKKTGKAVVKAGKAAGKAIASAVKGLVNLFISTLPWSAIILGCLLLIIIVAVAITSLLPGIGGDVNESDNYEQYSKTDKKTLEQIKKIFNKHPTADGTLAMSVVLYPYYNNLYSGNVTTYLETTGKNDDETEEDSSTETEEETDGQDDPNDKDIEQEEDVIEDDNYLIPLRTRKVRKRLEEVLKKLESTDEAGFKDYLKNEYFGNDKGFPTFWYHDLLGYNGYIKLLKIINDNDKETVKDLIIEDIYDNKELFVDYVFNNAICSATLVDAGNVAVDELLKSNLLVDVKVESCTTGKGVNSCDSWYPSPIPLGEYIKGVVWTEIGVSTNTDIEQIKAQMVAAKSFVLGRYKSMGWHLSQTEDGSYVLPIRPNTNDQDYCDYNVGCVNKRSGNKHGIAGEAEKNILNEAWEAVKNIYIIDDNNNTTGSYCADRSKHNSYDCSWCKHGYCLSQTELATYSNTSFENILGDQYSKYGLVTIEGEEASMKVAGDIVCSENITNYTAVRNQIALAIKKAKDNNLPHYENGLAKSKVFEENNFGSDVVPDSLGRDKFGLSNVGFVNYIYWNVLGNNFGNTNDINAIINDSFEITQDKLLVGDLGYSSDKSIIGIYYGKNIWAYMDKISNGIVIAPTDIFQKYIRLNNFKSETYNYWVRDHTPTIEEWGGDKMYIVPSNSKNIGQCVWYARNRAVEIITELKNNGSLTNEQYSRYRNRIVAQAGNGRDHAPGGSASKGFNGSTNVNDIKTGSFLGLESSTSPPYGHVAIVEKVDTDENGVITNIEISDGWARGTCSLYNFSCVNYMRRTFNSFQEYEKWVNGMVYLGQGRGRYKFRGYLYFLED